MTSLFWNKYFGNWNLKRIMIVYIGDSITFGANHFDPKKTSPPSIATKFLQEHLKDTMIYFANCGVGGATSMDFLPESKRFFLKVQKAADKFIKYENSSKQILFSILLGTNDSARKGIGGVSVTPDQYRHYLSVIINNLIRMYPGCKIVLHKPIWFSNNTYNAPKYLPDALERLVLYAQEIHSLVFEYSKSAPDTVFLGDTEGFAHFKNNYLSDHTHEKGDAGTFYLHPNKKGAAWLGEIWGKAILPVIQKTLSQIS